MKMLHRVYVTMNLSRFNGKSPLYRTKISQLMRMPHSDNITCNHLFLVYYKKNLIVNVHRCI